MSLLSKDEMNAQLAKLNEEEAKAKAEAKKAQSEDEQLKQKIAYAVKYLESCIPSFLGDATTLKLEPDGFAFEKEKKRLFKQPVIENIPVYGIFYSHGGQALPFSPLIYICKNGFYEDSGFGSMRKYYPITSDKVEEILGRRHYDAYWYQKSRPTFVASIEKSVTESDIRDFVNETLKDRLLRSKKE